MKWHLQTILILVKTYFWVKQHVQSEKKKKEKMVEERKMFLQPDGGYNIYQQQLTGQC